MKQIKIGLALGSGAARGLAHIGVLEAFEEEGIPTDLLAGTSAGAVIGVLYAQGKTPYEIRCLAMDLSKKRLTLVDPSLSHTGFLKGRKIQELLKSSIGGDLKFSDLKIPFACLATDISSGEEVIFNSGSVIEAIRASFSIPVIFTTVKRGGRYLVDGGLVNPVPVSILRQMGADFTIAVNVIPDLTGRIQTVKRGEQSKTPNIFTIIMQSIYIGTHSLARTCLDGADIVIEPEVASFNPGDFRHPEKLILEGKLAAQTAIPEISRKLQARKKQ